MLDARGPKAWANFLILWLLFRYPWKLPVIRCYTWFIQNGGEPVLIHKILICFKVILEIIQLFQYFFISENGDNLWSGWFAWELRIKTEEIHTPKFLWKSTWQLTPTTAIGTSIIIWESLIKSLKHRDWFDALIF